MGSLPPLGYNEKEPEGGSKMIIGWNYYIVSLALSIQDIQQSFKELLNNFKTIFQPVFFGHNSKSV